MDPTCLNYLLTDQERRQFEEDGYFIVKDVLPREMIPELIAVVDRIDAELRPNFDRGPYEGCNHFDFIGQDDIFLELLDWPRTFPKVWDLLGWHIQLYHSHVMVTPSLPEGQAPKRKRLGWHQDSGRLNIDLEGDPRPRISLKVAYFLTDCTDTVSGNFHAIPGSHLRNRLDLPEDGESDPEGATPIQVAPGDAVFFDRRLWHAGGHNRSGKTRKVLFYGYSYRWLKPRDDMTVAHYMDRCDPVRRQLLGDAPSGGHGFTSPEPEDIPLRAWIKEHVGKDAVVL
ncbi:MAG: phytanoyl-CoA dioxygenase family protein [Gemmatimonadota bacterium]|jgi:ectoine hydroxylase-related dioxygenase (phytanoyl-CoA dioxygenase family)|nr:phytanoyl-CoA dioxygenase family protein [Gemmatimonadota bacterium]